MSEILSSNTALYRRVFRFPPELRPCQVAELKKRAISPMFAIESGVRYAADNELRSIGFAAGLPRIEQKKGLQGLTFAYRDPVTRAVRLYRLKPDQLFTIGGKPAKYLSRKGDPVLAYFPHTTTAEMLSNPEYPAVLTEGEFKGLAIAENLSKVTRTRYAVIALQGVNGGWRREKEMTVLPDGTKERRSHNTPRLIPDLNNINWKKRLVYIVFDSDVGSKKNAALFMQSQRMGAMGAEYVLAQLLKVHGAEVRIVCIPNDGKYTKIGADDYIARFGASAFYNLMRDLWNGMRDPLAILNSREIG